MQGETPPSEDTAPDFVPVEQAWSLAEPAQEESAVAAAEGCDWLRIPLGVETASHPQNIAVASRSLPKYS